MSERTLRDRFHALGPLVLRVGIAVILLHNGLQRTSWMLKPDGEAEVPAVAPTPSESVAPATVTETVARATPDGVRFNADWGSLLGVGEVAAGGLLLIGLFTRLVMLPALAVLGYALFVGFPHASLPEPSTAMWLLAVACLSLLVSGSGSLALRRRRRHAGPSEAPPPRDRRAPPEEFMRARPSLIGRVRDWFARGRAVQHGPQPAAAAPARRWPWAR